MTLKLTRDLLESGSNKRNNLNMKSEQQTVANWMAKFGQETPQKPTIPSFEIRKLRVKLILEEAFETVRGLGFLVEMDKDDDDNLMPTVFLDEDTGCVLSEVMDGVADSLVVQLGTAVAVGLDVKPFFDEVMRSNDSKLWTTEEVETNIKEEISLFNKNHFTKDGVSYEWIGAKGGYDRWLVKDRDGKVIKSPSYSPADCESLVIKQANV